MDELFNEQKETIWCYIGAEDYEDPRRQDDVTYTDTDFIPIKAIVWQESPEKLNWKFYGIQTEEAKSFIIKNKDVDSIRQCYKIKHGDYFYYGYKSDTNKLLISILADGYTKITAFRMDE